MDRLPLALAEEVYRKQYWEPLQLSKLPANAQGIATYLLDMSVNHGPGRATVLLQRAIRALDYPIDVDGKMGPKTAAAMSFFADKYPRSLLGALKGERWKFYLDIVAARSDQKTFIRGWAARCA
jgi:lysozyme family protein